MEKVIGLVTCNYSAKESGPLSASRPVASMPFLGRYRLVDFALSNLVNCGIRTVGMVMPYNYRSLIDHVGSGKDWDLDRKNGGLFVLPGSAFGTSRTGARFLLRDLVHNKVFFTRSTADAVILTSANFVYNIDLDEVYAAHKESGADVTVVTRPSCGTEYDRLREDSREELKRLVNAGNQGELIEIFSDPDNRGYLHLREYEILADIARGEQAEGGMRFWQAGETCEELVRKINDLKYRLKRIEFGADQGKPDILYLLKNYSVCAIKTVAAAYEVVDERVLKQLTENM